MAHDWMIRTLDDLCRYARQHDFSALAEHLHQARLLAELELANAPGAARGNPADSLH